MATLFSSDSHFGHFNICKYCNRPFITPEYYALEQRVKEAREAGTSALPSLEEQLEVVKLKIVDTMDRTMIANWNKVVGPDDVVYHLGDFAVGGGPAGPYRRQLNGKIHLVIGNHEQRALRETELFESVDWMMEIKVDKQDIVLLHYALRVWNCSHHGAWSLFGHSHGSLPDDPNLLSLDVGVDCWNFTPVSMAQLRAAMAKKTFKPVDHHNEKTMGSSFRDATPMRAPTGVGLKSLRVHA